MVFKSCGGILELQREIQTSSCVGPVKTNLPFELRGRAGDCSLVTAVQNRPHLGLCPGPNFPLQGSCIGERNGNPLQCSCLENPRDGPQHTASVQRSHPGPPEGPHCKACLSRGNALVDVGEYGAVRLGGRLDRDWTLFLPVEGGIHFTFPLS